MLRAGEIVFPREDSPKLAIQHLVVSSEMVCIQETLYGLSRLHIYLGIYAHTHTYVTTIKEIKARNLRKFKGKGYSEESERRKGQGEMM